MIATIRGSEIMIDVMGLEYTTAHQCVGCVLGYRGCSGCPYNRVAVDEILDANLRAWSDRRGEFVEASRRFKQAALKSDELLMMAEEELGYE